MHGGVHHRIVLLEPLPEAPLAEQAVKGHGVLEAVVAATIVSSYQRKRHHCPPSIVEPRPEPPSGSTPGVQPAPTTGRERGSPATPGGQDRQPPAGRRGPLPAAWPQTPPAGTSPHPRPRPASPDATPQTPCPDVSGPSPASALSARSLFSSSISIVLFAAEPL